MYYKKLLRLYNLPEDCFNLFPENSHSIEINTVSTNSSQDDACTNEPIDDPNQKVSFQENNVESIETNVPTELAGNLSSAEIVDCYKCQFFVIEEVSPGENDYRCCFMDKYLTSTEVQCDNFEQKAELPIEPEIDDYTG
jgi:hypothetical protein